MINTRPPFQLSGTEVPTKSQSLSTESLVVTWPEISPASCLQTSSPRFQTKATAVFITLGKRAVQLINFSVEQAGYAFIFDDQDHKYSYFTIFVRFGVSVIELNEYILFKALAMQALTFS